jgi:hypothetical protein
VPKLAIIMDAAEHDVLACVSFPMEHRAKLHSTIPIERLNGEIKRRTDVVGIFPDDQVIVRLAGARLREQADKWAVQRARYMALKTIAPIGEDPVISLPAAASRSSRPAPNITVTISASHTNPCDTIPAPAARDASVEIPGCVPATPPRCARSDWRGRIAISNA